MTQGKSGSKNGSGKIEIAFYIVVTSILITILVLALLPALGIGRTSPINTGSFDASGTFSLILAGITITISFQG
jgi:hypothetical protein